MWLNPGDRELLERVAVLEGITLSEVWRRALTAYGRDLGLIPDGEGEPV